MQQSQVAFGAKLSYGVGQAAEGMKNGAFGIFLLFYYNHVLGLSGTLTGLALGIALVFDAVTDPLVGSMSDNWRSVRGRRHPFMYAAIVPLALSFYFLLAPPDFGAYRDIGLFAWLLTFAVLARGAMTLYYVPHVALGAELSTDFAERTMIVGFRQFFGTFGALSVVIGFGVFFAATPEYPRGQFDPDAYAPYALTLSVLMSIAIFVSAWGTRAYIPRLRRVAGPEVPVSAFGSLVLREAGEALGNRSFRWMFLGILVVFLMVGVDGALNLYVNAFFWGLQPNELLYFYIASPIGVMLGSVVAARLNTRFGKRASVVWGTAWWSLCQIVPIVLRMLDAFPENGTDALLGTLIVIKFVQGVGVAQALVTFGSMVADIADEHELQFGKRQEGIFFAAASFANKCTTGVGSMVAGVALDLIAWPRGAHIVSPADVPPETIFRLGLVYGPIVSGFAVVCVWCRGHYDLSRERHQEILAALAERARNTAAATPDTA